MAGTWQYLYNNFTTALRGQLPDDPSSPESEDDNDGSPLAHKPHKPHQEPGNYHPSVDDVLEVKSILFNSKALPLELIDNIIDFAEYWPRTYTRRSGGEISIHSGRNRENVLILRTYPLGYTPTDEDPTDLSMLQNAFPTLQPIPSPQDLESTKEETELVKKHWLETSRIRGEYPCRKIVFTIKSHDQGWGGSGEHRGSYQGSSTWFDVGKETISVSREEETKDTDKEKDIPEERPQVQLNFEPTPLPSSSSSSSSSTQTPSQENSISKVHLNTLIPSTNTRETAHEPPLLEHTFHHPLDPTGQALQRNRTAILETNSYTITWSITDDTNPEGMGGKELDDKGRGRETANGEFVRGLQVGDTVTVWAKARYPGWVNNVEEVGVEVFWSV